MLRREFAWSTYGEKVAFCCFWPEKIPTNHLTWRHGIQKVRKWLLVVKILHEIMRDMLQGEFSNLYIWFGTIFSLLQNRKVTNFTLLEREFAGLFAIFGFNIAVILHSEKSDDACDHFSDFQKIKYEPIKRCEPIEIPVVSHRHHRFVRSSNIVHHRDWRHFEPQISGFPLICCLYFFTSRASC